MYSVVLMMALSGGAETPELGHRCKGSCSGSACSGSCHGRAPRAHKSKCHGRAPKCHGGRKHSRCHGGSRCSGGYACSGAPVYSGCSGAPYSGCSGAPGCSGSAPVNPPKTMPRKAPQKTEAPAVLQVSLPADARLMVDGYATTSTSSQRTFITPALPQGEAYQYTLRAEIVRNGQTVVETKQVTVRGGEETSVPFSFSSVVTASH